MGIMFSQELSTDVTFHVSSSLTGEPETIKAHKCMLISASPVFWTMLYGELQETGEIVVSDVEPQAFKQMLRYIYTEQCNLSGDNVMHIVHVSKKYDIPLLTKECVEFMDKGLDASNAFTILEHSLFFEEKDLSKKCIDIIEKHTQDAFSSKAFEDISQKTLAYVLDSDNLSLDEINIFKRCYEWAEKNKNDISTREALGQALYKIRFPTMTSQEFTKCVRPTYILTTDEQSSIYAYLAVPDEQNRPSLFECLKRKGKAIIMVGSRVRVKQSVLTPSTGWGSWVTHKSVGVVESMNKDTVYINFPEHSNWEGVLHELEVA